MRFVMALVGGIVGGLIGAAIWAGIAYGTNHEIGWIAWGIGFLVGVGVRLGAQEWDGALPGMLAVVLAVLAVVGGKYATVSLLMSKLGGDEVINISSAEMKESIAREVVEERSAKGPPLKWPAGKTAETALTFADFPADVQQAATKQWDGYSPSEQQQKIDARKKQLAEIHRMVRGAVHNMAFQQSFSGMDILFFLLAAYTAFRVGSGAAAEED